MIENGNGLITNLSDILSNDTASPSEIRKLAEDVSANNAINRNSK